MRDCEWADDLAVALVDAPILARIKVLDLSLGNLGDRGALALAAAPVAAGLESIDIHHHYVSDEAVAKLNALGPRINAEDREEPDMWGLMLVDIARHAARAYARESEYTEEEALSRIIDMFEAEVARPTDPGSTTPRSKQGH